MQTELFANHMHYFIRVLIILALLAACSPTHLEEDIMYTLEIDLQEGFDGDQVVIDINGKEAFRQENVSTKLLLGYAETKAFPLPPGKTTVTISLPQKKQTTTINLNLEANTYLGVSVTPAGLDYILSDKPFFYQ